MKRHDPARTHQPPMDTTPAAGAGAWSPRRMIVRSGVHHRRLALCAAVAAVALMAGGGLAVLVTIMMVIVAIDAVVPLPGRTMAEADERFRLTVAQRRRAAVMQRLRGREPGRLEVLDDASGWASSAGRRSLGVQAIPVEAITGTAEELKARTFDRAFRPDASRAEHWKRLWVAQSRGAVLPPISVYRVGGAYVVRDGHHRVSVAREQGISLINADVVELLRAGRQQAGSRRAAPVCDVSLRASAARSGDGASAHCRPGR